MFAGFNSGVVIEELDAVPKATRRWKVRLLHVWPRKIIPKVEESMAIRDLLQRSGPAVARRQRTCAILAQRRRARALE